MRQVGSVTYDREGVANHAKNLANTIRGNLRRSLEAIGVVRVAPGDCVSHIWFVSHAPDPPRPSSMAMAS